MKKENGVSLAIVGDVPAKKNMYRVGRGNFYLDASVASYQKSFNVQCREQLGVGYAPLSRKMALSCYFYVKRDKDLDNLLNGLLDALQAAQVIENDRLIIQITTSKGKDAKNPRAIVNLQEIL